MNKTIFRNLRSAPKPTAQRKSKVSARIKVSDVDEYLAAVPEPARSTLDKVRAAILSVVPPEATEKISYGIPTVNYKGGLVAFAAFTNHCSLFPMSYAVIKAFKSELKDFTVSKGTIRFPLDQPLPAPLLKKIVKARVAEKRLSSRQRLPPLLPIDILLGLGCP